MSSNQDLSAVLPTDNFFERLSDDWQWLIAKEVATFRRPRYDEPKPIKQLSLVNKRIRHLCVPIIFDFDKLRIDEEEYQLTGHMRAMVKAPFVASKLVYVRNVNRRID